MAKKKYNKTQLSVALGKSVPTITNWQKQPDFPMHKTKSGRYEFFLDEVQSWMDGRGKETTEVKVDLNAEKLRKVKLDADLAQLKYEKELGLLVPIEDVATVVETEYATIKTHLLALPNSLAPTLVNKGEAYIYNEIKTKIEKILNALSDPEDMLTEETDNSESEP